MYLSRLTLNPAVAEVRRDLADCHQLHRTIMGAFPPDGGKGARARFGVLHRLEVQPRTQQPVLYVQSGIRPDWTHLPRRYLLEGPAVKELSAHYEAIQSGMFLRFRLLANVTRKVKSGPEGIRKNGRRVMIWQEGDQIDWLRRHGEAGGFEVIELSSQPGTLDLLTVNAPTGWRWGKHPAGRLAFGAVLFEGRLRVTDAARFRETLAQGVGPAKAYGHGLLSVAKV